MSFSILLKELRLEKAISQAKLAEILGLTQDSISLWEKGKSLPATPYLIKLADFFGVSTDYLLGRSDDFGNIVLPTNSPTVPALSDEERQLLDLFSRMDRAQKVRTVAYCEGMLGISVSKLKA